MKNGQKQAITTDQETTLGTEIDIHDKAALAREYGSLEDLRQSQEIYKAKQQEKTGTTGNLKALQEYSKKLNMQKDTTFKLSEEIKSARSFFALKARKSTQKPNWLSYDNARPLFWEAYKAVIFRDKWRLPVVDEHLQRIIPHFVRWLIGDNSGLYPINKSLYFFGSLGVGKSALAEAGFLFLERLRIKHGWADRAMKHKSLDEAFYKVYTANDLTGFSDLQTGSWVLDELREKHLHYKHFGNDIFLIDDLLTIRYNLWKKGHQTIITANIPPKKLGDVLTDKRTFDRVKEQYSIIKLQGENKRHIKK